VRVTSRLLITVTLWIGAVAARVDAADVEVRYLAERAPLRALAATAEVTIELHTDATCGDAVVSETVRLADFQAIVDLTRVRLRGAPRAARLVELRRVVAGLPGVGAVYARVRGDGIVPVGGTCQAQTFVPPPAMPRPVVRDANGALIGTLSVLDRDTYGVLADDGYGAYGLAIGRSLFAAFDFGLLFATPDCSGSPFLQLYFYPHVRTAVVDGTIYGPAGAPRLTAFRSASDESSGCFEDSYEEYAVPAVPLDLGRFVPPFVVHNLPPTP
jgi:hypothetical protein